MTLRRLQIKRSQIMKQWYDVLLAADTVIIMRPSTPSTMLCLRLLGGISSYAIFLVDDSMEKSVKRAKKSQKQCDFYPNFAL